MKIKKSIHLAIAGISLMAINSSVALEKNQTAELSNKLMQNNVIAKLYSSNELSQIIAKAQYKQSVLDAFKRTAESLTWGQYRPIFIKDSLVNSGVKFANQHKQDLLRAEAEYGVPKEIILAILGVETAFGQNKGKHKILDSLSTLSLGYERRKDFFFGELESFLILTKQNDIDVLNTKGSYAGAMGFPQFISSSYLSYAVDFNGDNRVDLLNSATDAIGSIANYLAVHDWKKGQPIYSEISSTGSNIDKFVSQERKTLFDVATLNKSSIELQTKVNDATPVTIIDLKSGSNIKYRAAFNNFYVITTYNHSKLYAMAVTELSEKINQQLSF